MPTQGLTVEAEQAQERIEQAACSLFGTIDEGSGTITVAQQVPLVSPVVQANIQHLSIRQALGQIKKIY